MATSPPPQHSLTHTDRLAKPGTPCTELYGHIGGRQRPEASICDSTRKEAVPAVGTQSATLVASPRGQEMSNDVIMSPSTWLTHRACLSAAVGGWGQDTGQGSCRTSLQSGPEHQQAIKPLPWLPATVGAYPAPLCRLPRSLLNPECRDSTPNPDPPTPGVGSQESGGREASDLSQPLLGTSSCVALGASSCVALGAS